MAYARTVTKEFKFEAAHRLLNYEGKCKNLHGHSWVVYLKVGLKSSELNKIGMVFDFGDFKPMKEWIDQSLDHSLIISNEDEELLDFNLSRGHSTFVTNGNPTSEVLTEIIFNYALHLLKLPSHLELIEVRIKETCTSEASYGIKN